MLCSPSQGARSSAIALVVLGMLGCIDRRNSAVEPVAADAFTPPPCLTDTECDDANPCTDDRCEPSFGCVAQPHLRACDDGDACTVGDACRAGACQPGSLAVCDDGDPCTADACDPAVGCASQPRPPGTWVSEVVDGLGDVGEYSALVVDAQGTLHVVYRDGEAGAMRYARRAIGGEWRTERVGERGGLYSVIASNADGVVHVASIDHDDNLTHAVAAGAEPLVATRYAPIIGSPIALAAGPEGRAYIVFSRVRNRLELGTIAPGDDAIELEPIPLGPEDSAAPALAIDPERRLIYLVHRLLVRPPDGELRLATRALDGGEWSVERIAGDSAWPTLGGRGAAMDPLGRLHLTYVEDEVLRYAVREPDGRWAVDDLPSQSQVRDEALGVDPEGEPLIAHTSRDGVALVALRRDGDGLWVSEEVARHLGPSASPGGMHQDASVAYDPVRETWHLVWFDVHQRDLRHGWRCPDER